MARVRPVASCVYCREPMTRTADIVAPDGSQWGEASDGAAHRACAFAESERKVADSVTTGGEGGAKVCGRCKGRGKVYRWNRDEDSLDEDVCDCLLDDWGRL